MKKILLSLAVMLTSVGAWAQDTNPEPVLTIITEGVTLPYEVPAEQATTIAGMDDMTIVATVRTPTQMNGRKLLVCGADPTQVAVTAGTKDNSPYFGFGFNAKACGYLASSLAGDRFTAGELGTPNALHSVVYVISATEGWVKIFIDGQIIHSQGNEKLFTNGAASGYQLQTFKKLFNNDTYKENAKIYIGGGKLTNGSGEIVNNESFGGTVYNVKFYNTALSNEQVQSVSAEALPPSGNFYRISYDYGENGGVKYLQSVASPVKGLAYAEDKGASSIFYYGDGKLLSYSAGKYIKEQGSDRGLQPIGTACVAEIIPSKRDLSKYVLNLGAFLHANGGNNDCYSDHCSSNACANHDHNVEVVTELPVTITDAGYASFYAPVAVTLPTGLKAYYVSAANNTKATMTEVGNVIPANTGVILQGEPNTYNLTIGGTAEAIEENKLEGTAAATYVAKDAYVLAAKDGVGFYKATLNQSNNTAFLNNGFKAYLPVAGVASARLLFDFGTETAIESIEGAENADAVVYDLAGRRVKGAQKGLYIVNGKVVIK